MDTENNYLNEELLNKAIRSEDNVPRDQSGINQLILQVKMAFLIFIMALSGKIRSYLKSSGKPHETIFGRPLHEKSHEAQRVIIDLPRPLEVYDPETKNHFRYPIREFYLAPAPDSPDEFQQTGPFRLHLKHAPEMWCDWRHSYYYEPEIANNMIQKCRDQFLLETDWFTLLQPYTPYKGIRSTAHFFGVHPLPYAPYNTALGSMKPESFLPTDDEDYWSEMKNQHPSLGEASLIERELQGIIDGTNPSFREVYSSKIEDCQQVFDFKDEYGYPGMKVIKKYDYRASGTVKAYITITQWNQSGKPDSSYQMLPLPGKQPLFNLDKIVHADQIVFCPDLEIANALQSLNQDDNVAYTTFLCDDVNSQVDISPVKKKSLCLLVINHSGLTLAEAYIETQKLYNFFTENKIATDIGVIQAEVNYPAAPKDFNSIAQFMEYHRNHQKPYIKPGSLIVMDTEEQFREMVNSAKAEIERKAKESQDKSFWAPEEEPDASNPSVESIIKNEHLFYPFIARGAISYLVGESGIGKSNLMAAICASLVNTSQRRPEIFPERCWSGCKVNNGYDRLKILHLDHESGQGGIKKREMDFVDPYLPDDKTERQLCKDNYIVEDLLTDSTNYAEESHFEDLCRLIESKTDQGTKGQPVDILIIDTFQSFVHERDCDHWVLKKLIERYPNMAIVVLHHLENGEFVGLKAKKRIAQATVYLTRDKVDEKKETEEKKTLPDHTPNLHDPFKVEIKNLKLPHAQEDEEVFFAKFNENNRFVVIDSPRSKAQMIKCIQESLGYDKEKLASLLGMGEEKLNKYLSEAKREARGKE